ncbi:MAG: ImmA/IrrE family metallo-endopeptidase [Sphingomonas sp.]|uniref:ImmA/IrrE family metallo-endopeptidase n=1 Tax=Sphingomonas sp. TaxID=28214 RepID=UPI003F7E5BE9
MSDIPVAYARVRKISSELIADQQQPPVALEPILAKLGAELRHVEVATDISGILIRDGERKIVAVNNEHSDVRQRFTIAHEIGHLMLHEGEEVHVDSAFRVNLRDPRSGTAENIQEVEANAFAANLLMPADWVRRALGETWIDLNDDSEIARLADLFKVSQQAMLIRLTNLLRR